ncbi:MAG: hypothetical protein J7L12_04090 [Desulfurococcales archaeon]|nr:hypothetical protein [Desulfurococcales archaeon]
MNELKAIRDAALAAANYLRRERRGSEVVGRGAFGDITKAFDREAEEIILGKLRDYFSDELVVISEERGIVKFSEKASWIAIVDPVDGSTNYDAGIPWVAVSIGLAPAKEGTPTKVSDIVAAVIAEVFRDRVYEYHVDYGALLNGSPAKRRSEPKNVLLGYFEVPEAYEPVPKYWKLRGSRAALRSLGSAALDIVYVGLGMAEGFIDARAKLRNVDVAAALRIATALGARGLANQGIDVGEIRIDDLVKVELLVVGYNEDYLKMLGKACLIKGA